MKIMFICTGNTCRSAMAEAIMKRKVHEEKLPIEISSCGIYATNGESATEYSIQVLKERGIDLTKHQATNIKNSRIKEMDILLCATEAHKIMLKNLYPELKDKVYTIKEFAHLGEEEIEKDIKDPWGNSLETYKKIAKELEENIKLILQRIKKEMV